MRNETEKDDLDFDTIKKAKENGFAELKPYQYGGLQIEMKNKTYAKNPENAKSKTAWAKLGRVVIDGVEPHAIKSGRVNETNVTYPVYRIDQTIDRSVAIAAFDPIREMKYNFLNR